MAQDDPFVTIRVAGNPVEAEMLRDVLEQEGIAVTTQGAQHGALYGMAGGAILRTPVQVRTSRAKEAADIIAALDEYDTILPEGEDGPAVPAREMQRRLELEDASDEGEGPYRAGPVVRGSQERPRLRRIALCSALVLTFGTGHFYARDNRGGFVLLLTELLAVALAVGGAPQAFGAVPILIAADMVGSLYAVARANGEEPAGGIAALGRHASVIGAALALTLVLLPALF